jgi:hypothetical protein
MDIPEAKQVETSQELAEILIEHPDCILQVISTHYNGSEEVTEYFEPRVVIFEKDIYLVGPDEVNIIQQDIKETLALREEMRRRDEREREEDLRQLAYLRRKYPNA